MSWTCDTRVDAHTYRGSPCHATRSYADEALPRLPLIKANILRPARVARSPPRAHCADAWDVPCQSAILTSRECVQKVSHGASPRESRTNRGDGASQEACIRRHPIPVCTKGNSRSHCGAPKIVRCRVAVLGCKLSSLLTAARSR